MDSKDFLSTKIVNFVYLQPDITSISKLENKFRDYSVSELHTKLQDMQADGLIELLPKSQNVQTVGYIKEITDEHGKTSTKAFDYVDPQAYPLTSATHVRLLLPGKELAEYRKYIWMKSLRTLVSKPLVNTVVSFLAGLITTWLLHK